METVLSYRHILLPNYIAPQLEQEPSHARVTSYLLLRIHNTMPQVARELSLAAETLLANHITLQLALEVPQVLQVLQVLQLLLAGSPSTPHLASESYHAATRVESTPCWFATHFPLSTSRQHHAASRAKTTHCASARQQALFSIEPYCALTQVELSDYAAYTSQGALPQSASRRNSWWDS